MTSDLIYDSDDQDDGDKYVDDREEGNYDIRINTKRNDNGQDDCEDISDGNEDEIDDEDNDDDKKDSNNNNKSKNYF